MMREGKKLVREFGNMSFINLLRRANMKMRRKGEKRSKKRREVKKKRWTRRGRERMEEEEEEEKKGGGVIGFRSFQIRMNIPHAALSRPFA